MSSQNLAQHLRGYFELVSLSLQMSLSNKEITIVKSHCSLLTFMDTSILVTKELLRSIPSSEKTF
jgi:hypothetical protein